MRAIERNIRVACCALVLACAGPGAATADPTLKVVSEGPYQPAATRQFVLHSERLGHDILAVVSSPPPSAVLTPGQKLPAIYALDSGYGIAGPVAQMMVWGAAMSPAYVISIGYPDGKPFERDRDLLHHQTVRDGATIGGGGAAFQAFLTDELRPFLEARFPLDPGRAILFGHSYGGLFAANVLATAPNAFFGYIIASPSTPADPQVIPRLATTVPNGAAPRVFVAAGEKEDDLLEGTRKIAAALSARRSAFVVEEHIFPGATHISYYPQLTPAAFAWMLPPSAVVARKAITLPASALERLAGVYALADGRTVTTTTRDGKLFAYLTGMPGGEVLAESPTTFFVNGYDVLLTFEMGDQGPARALVLHINGADARAVRRDDQSR
jgi:predicted alpha/beta superfamily hydrolase